MHGTLLVNLSGQQFFCHYLIPRFAVHLMLGTPLGVELWQSTSLIGSLGHPSSSVHVGFSLRRLCLLLDYQIQIAFLKNRKWHYRVTKCVSVP